MFNCVPVFPIVGCILRQTGIAIQKVYLHLIAILVYHNGMYPNPVGIVCVQQIEIHVFCKQVGHPHP